MKTDDIFEAITDINDKYIEQARKIDDTSTAQPVYKPLWKTLLPVAACAAALCAASVLGVKYFGRTEVSEISEFSEPYASLVSDVKVPDAALVEEEFKYPEDAEYVTSRAAFTGDELRLNWEPEKSVSDFEYAENYDELAAKSDLIIAGTIADETRQNIDPEASPTEGGEVYSYGYLNVESVIKGEVKLGENVLIRQNSAISRDGAEYVLRMKDALSPMFKGDRWVYFLEKNGDFYKPVNGAQGRYPMPGSNNIALDEGAFDSFGTLEDSIRARDEIYATVGKQLTTLIQHIEIPKDGSDVTFYLEEQGFSYSASERGISVVMTENFDSAEQTRILESRKMLDLYIYDIGGDGRRDLFAVVNSNGAQSIVVIGGGAYDMDGDIVCGPVYSLVGNFEFDYDIEEENGVLYAVKRKFQKPWEQTIPEELSREPISLEKMEMVEIGLPERITIPSDGSETIFTLDDGSGIKYTASREGVFADGKCLIEGELESLYLEKLDKSGAKLICAAVSRNGAGTVEILADKLYRLTGKPHDIYDVEAKSYSLEFEYGTLNLVTTTEQYDTSTDDKIPIYFYVLDMMTPVSSNDHIDEIKLGNGNKTFAMEEYPDLTFTVTSENDVLMSDNTDNSPAKGIFGTGTGLANCGLYLCDLNGDDKRELCVWGSIGSGIDYRFVNVYDIANGVYYSKNANGMSELYSLDLRNGELYFVTSEYGNENNEISREPLTLEILEKLERSESAYEELCLDVDSQFTLEEYPDYVFTIKTYEKKSNAISISFPNGGSCEYSVGSAYLSDVDGDGRRELCMNILLTDVESIVVWGYIEEGKAGEKMFFGKNCWIETSADTLYINYGNEVSRPLTVEKSDFSPVGETKYKEITPGEQSEIQSELYDVPSDYGVENNVDTLRVTRPNKLDENGEPCGDLEWSIYEPTTLYRYSYQNKQLLVCTSPLYRDNGYITEALELADGAFTCYELGKFSVMPQNGELALVDNDGTAKPFALPENGEVVRFR